jgi:hypothetical protein
MHTRRIASIAPAQHAARKLRVALLCVLALLLAQALGLAHRVVHSPLASQPWLASHMHAHASVHAHEHEHAHTGHNDCAHEDPHAGPHGHSGGIAGLLVQLFEGEHHQCRLLDAATSGDDWITSSTASSYMPLPPIESQTSADTPRVYRLSYAHLARAPPAAFA